jgi:hypothetical protein
MKTLFAIVVGICSTATLNAQQFTDITSTAGLQSTNGGEGIAIGDYNNDGYDDFYVSFPDGKNQLYRNNGNETFTEVGEELSVALGNNIDTRASVWGDLNNDGWLDLYVGNRQDADQLFLNKGDGTFEEISFEAGIYQQGHPKSVNMADVNGDGFLDIYVSNFTGENVLYLNNGNLTFINYTYASGALDTKKVMGTVFFDYDKDGDTDLYIVHDSNESNFLYQNDGNGVFTDVSEASGANTESFGMGVDVGDINNDGWLDIYITNLFKNILLLNNGDGTFSNISDSADVADFGMGWGVSFWDFDNDGKEDIYVANDYQFSPYPNVLYKNKGNLIFEKAEENSPICNQNKSYGAACFDFNLDGQTDILVANKGENESLQLFKNADRQNHWITIKLNGTTSNRNAIGSKIQIIDNLGNIHYKEVIAGQSWSSQNSLLLHFGLGAATEIVEMKVLWISGLEEIVTVSGLDKVYTITENQGIEEEIVYLVDTPPDSSLAFDFSIAPNPNQGIFSLEFYTANENPVFIVIYNTTGQLIFSKKVAARSGKNIIPIEMKITNNQVVMIRVFNEDFSKTRRCFVSD